MSLRARLAPAANGRVLNFEPTANGKITYDEVTDGSSVWSRRPVGLCVIYGIVVLGLIADLIAYLVLYYNTTKFSTIKFTVDIPHVYADGNVTTSTTAISGDVFNVNVYFLVGFVLSLFVYLLAIGWLVWAPNHKVHEKGEDLQSAPSHEYDGAADNVIPIVGLIWFPCLSVVTLWFLGAQSQWAALFIGLASVAWIVITHGATIALDMMEIMATNTEEEKIGNLQDALAWMTMNSNQRVFVAGTFTLLPLFTFCMWISALSIGFRQYQNSIALVAGVSYLPMYVAVAFLLGFFILYALWYIVFVWASLVGLAGNGNGKVWGPEDHKYNRYLIWLFHFAMFTTYNAVVFSVSYEYF